MTRLKAFFVCSFLVALLPILTGCGEITVDIEVADDGRIDFSEDILLEGITVDYLGLLVKPGDNDFWTRLKKHSKEKGLEFKQKTANHIVINGQFPPNQQQEVCDVINQQFATIVDGYGSRQKLEKPFQMFVARQPEESQQFLSSAAKVAVDYDITREHIEEYYEFPSQWADHMWAAMQQGIQLKLRVRKIPGTVSDTNGVYEKEKRELIFTPKYGGKGKMFAVVQRTHWPAILTAVIVIVMAASTVLLRNRKKQASPDKE